MYHFIFATVNVCESVTLLQLQSKTLTVFDEEKLFVQVF